MSFKVLYATKVSYTDNEYHLKKLLNITYAENVPQTFTKARKIIETMISKLERQFQRDIDAYSKNNLKLFWLHAYSKLKTKN